MASSEDSRVFNFPWQHKDLFGLDGKAESQLVRILKAENRDYSNRETGSGEKPHPFDFQAVIDFQHSNEHHSACLQAKVNAIVGLGHLTDEDRAYRKATMASQTGAAFIPPKVDNTTRLSKVDIVLNDLCETTWQETQSDVAEDFCNLGNGYFEVVRRDGDTVTGIYHIPAEETFIHVDDEKGNYHYIVRSRESGGDSNGDRRFARFGDKQDMIERLRLSDSEAEAVSEVIHLRRPSSKSRWYGYPDWLSAVASIELVQMVVQQNFDFYLNRGVPEFMALFLGQKLPKSDWDKIHEALLGTIGVGNNYKSIAVNLQVPETFRVQVEKLAAETSSPEWFAPVRENLALSIVSAHRVPPLLAGIQIPGKLGATNELPNALVLFQLLVIAPYQRMFQQTLGSTLGSESAGLGLTMEDFEYRKITDEIDVGKMDTVSRMRQSPMQARSEGRDLSAGVKE